MREGARRRRCEWANARTGEWAKWRVKAATSVRSLQDNAVQTANRPFAGAPFRRRPSWLLDSGSWLLVSRCRKLKKPLDSSDGNRPTETDPDPSSDNGEMTQ